MNNWKMTLYRLMQGRYGNDEFSQFLMLVGMVLLLASNFFPNIHELIRLLAWALLFYAMYRVMSKNILKRQQENFKFQQVKANLLKKKAAGAGGWQNRKANRQNTQQTDYSQYQQDADVENYNYYRCRNCGQIVRVPKGKGTVKITCPECKNTFTDRT